jgi:putative ABC transport system substrate-binding protein
MPAASGREGVMAADRQGPARIGTIMTGDASHPAFAALREGLAALGYAEGRDIVLEPRFDGGRLDTLPALGAELVAAGVEVIAAVGAVQSRAAQRATREIPIVFGVVVDPVAVGLVAAMDRPGGNATGATNYDPDQARTQIRLFRRALPRLERLAILSDAGVPDALPKANRAAAEAENIRPQVILARGAEDLDDAFAAMRQEGADAVLALPVPITGNHGRRIAGMAAAARLPTMFGRDHARFGPMLAFGTGLPAVARRMAPMLDRILRGANPADMAVERVIAHELVVNRGTARAVGVTLPPDLLAEAQEIAGQD